MSSTWKLIKPHVPLIRFRKGGITKVISSFGAAKPADDSSHDPNVISDRQLPKRYCRKPISQEEIDLVELGGAV